MQLTTLGVTKCSVIMVKTFSGADNTMLTMRTMLTKQAVMFFVEPC